MEELPLEEIEYVDMLGRSVFLTPKENYTVVSLVPSQTELLYELGLEKQILGQTLFCVHPEEHFKKATKVGGTKKLNLLKIEALNPDIIIANKEENNKEDIEALSAKFPVWVSDIQNLEDNYRFIQEMGDLFNRIGQAQFINQLIRMSMAMFQAQSRLLGSALYLIWKDPLMAAGQDTFINHMMEVAGYENVLETSRYPELSLDQIQALQPQYVLLSSEPFPFKDEHVEEFQKALPNSIVKIVDGEMFSWYGSRMKYAAGYFKTLMNDA